MKTIEDCVLDFYDWIITVDEKETYDKYSSIVAIATKLINKMESEYNPKINKSKITSKYFYLDSIFNLDSMQHKYFTIDEIKVRRNKLFVEHYF